MMKLGVVIKQGITPAAQSKRSNAYSFISKSMDAVVAEQKVLNTKKTLNKITAEIIKSKTQIQQAKLAVQQAKNELAKTKQNLANAQDEIKNKQSQTVHSLYGGNRTHNQYWPISQITYEGNKTHSQQYIYLQGRPIALLQTKATGQSDIYYYQNNHLNAPLKLTDKNQNSVWQAEQKGFEFVVHQKDVVQPLRFPGQIEDGETGFYYNYNRYYNPEIGRYTQPDPIGLAGGINPYVYADNNPIMNVDPRGERFRPLGRRGYGGGGTNGGAGGRYGQTRNGYFTRNGRYIPPSIPVIPRNLPPEPAYIPLLRNSSNSNRSQEIIRSLMRQLELLENPLNSKEMELLDILRKRSDQKVCPVR